MAIMSYLHDCEVSTVHEYEFEGDYFIWVCDKYGSSKYFPWHGFGTSLDHKWWQWSSPAERIRKYRSRAQAYAKKLNSKALYIKHEKELVQR